MWPENRVWCTIWKLYHRTNYLPSLRQDCSGICCYNCYYQLLILIIYVHFLYGFLSTLLLSQYLNTMHACKTQFCMLPILIIQTLCWSITRYTSTTNATWWQWWDYGYEHLNNSSWKIRLQEAGWVAEMEASVWTIPKRIWPEQGGWS